jgi:hypothetical protein
MILRGSKLSCFLLLSSYKISGVRFDCYWRSGRFSVALHLQRQRRGVGFWKQLTQLSSGKIRPGAVLLSCGRGTNNCCLPGDLCGSNLLCTQNAGIAQIATG